MDQLKDSLITDRISRLKSENVIHNNIIDDLPKIDGNLKLRELENFAKSFNDIRNKAQEDLSFQSWSRIKSFKDRLNRDREFSDRLLNKFNIQLDENGFLKTSSSNKDLSQIGYDNINIKSGLDLFTKNKENFSSNSDLVNKEDLKIFGDLGDITLNELANKTSNFVAPLVEFVQNHPNLTGVLQIGGTVLTPMLIYRGIINMYNKTVPSYSSYPVNPSVIDIKSVRRERLIFLLIAAPMLTFSLYHMNKSYFNAKLNLDVNINSDNSSLESNTSNPENSGGPVLSSLLFFSNKNFRWKWLFIFLSLIFIGILFKFKFINLETVNNLNILNYLGIPSSLLKEISVIFLVILFIFILRYIIIIYIIYLHSKNKVSTSIFMPSFISNWINNYKNYGKYDKESLKKVINFYYMHMYIYTFIFFIYLFIYVFIN